MAPLTGRSGRRQPHSALAQNLEYQTPATAISEAQPILVFPFPMLSRTVTTARGHEEIHRTGGMQSGRHAGHA
jgi:hypothetical protein